MRHLAVVLAAILIPTASRADILPDGHKGLKLSLHVDAEVPAGKALVLANTFEGGVVVAPGSDQSISWHPMGGPMQLRLIDAAQADTIKAAAADLDRDKSRPILDAAAVCHPPFPGVRTIVDSSPAVQLRWTFRAAITGDTCSAELVKEEYLDEAGKAVPAPPAPGEPSGPVPAPLADSPTPPTPATPAAPAPAAPPAAPVQAASCGGCDVDGSGAGGLAVLALALLRRRRRASAA